MKQAENNEIDLLLRDLGKREGAETHAQQKGTGGSEEKAVGAHLDADELSSFAEGAFPAATRSLYAAHLADCEQCRKIVSRLALASGVGLQQIRDKKAPQTTWWRYLANFFTPRVMRYAVPALSLVILAAIGLVWLRQGRQETFVARNNEAASASSTEQFGGNQAGVVAESSTQSSNAAPAQVRRAQAKAGDVAERDENSQNRNEVASAGTVETAKEGAKSSESKDSSARSNISPAAAAVQAPAPKPTTETAADSKREVFAIERQRATDAVQSEEEKRSRRDKDDAAGKKAKATPETAQLAGQLMGDSKPGMRTGGERSATRTVSGRRFIREENVWVDTGYDSSTQTINVTRGSEQYRALVGDEPGLKTIAEQLVGEVIVVWKGKAYRIR